MKTIQETKTIVDQMNEQSDEYEYDFKSNWGKPNTKYQILAGVVTELKGRKMKSDFCKFTPFIFEDVDGCTDPELSNNDYYNYRLRLKMNKHYGVDMWNYTFNPCSDRQEFFHNNLKEIVECIAVNEGEKYGDVIKFIKSNKKWLCDICINRTPYILHKRRRIQKAIRDIIKQGITIKLG